MAEVDAEAEDDVALPLAALPLATLPLWLAELPLELTALPDDCAAGKVEVTTGAVDDGVKLAVPSSTVRYVACIVLI